MNQGVLVMIDAKKKKNPAKPLTNHSNANKRNQPIRTRNKNLQPALKAGRRAIGGKRGKTLASRITMVLDMFLKFVLIG